MSENLSPGRRTTRLEGFDYGSAGAYFVTICAYRRALVFENETLAGILHDEWQALPSRFPSAQLDAFVVMPNHVHFIIWLSEVPDHVGVPLAGTLAAPETPAGIRDADRAGASPAPTLGAVVGAYKSLVAVRWLNWIKANDPTRGAHIWQRNYYDRIIRNEDELNRIREYIVANPAMWHHDAENPVRITDADYENRWAWLEHPPP